MILWESITTFSKSQNRFTANNECSENMLCPAAREMFVKGLFLLCTLNNEQATPSLISRTQTKGGIDHAWIRNREVFLTAHHLYLNNKTVELEWLVLPHGSQCVSRAPPEPQLKGEAAWQLHRVRWQRRWVTEVAGYLWEQNRWCLKVSSCSNAMQHTSNRASFLD